MLFLKIALRNILAHRRKNIIVFSVTAGVCFFLFLFLAFSDGEIENIKNGISSFYAPYSDIKGVTQDYLHLREQNEDTREEIIENTLVLKESLIQNSYVHEVIAQVGSNYGNIFSNGKKYLDFNFIALDPDDKTLRSKYRIIEGRDISGLETGYILMHNTVRKYLPLRVGDEVMLVGNDFFDQVSSISLIIAGFFEPNLDNPNLTNVVLLASADLSVYNGYAPDEANLVMIRLSPQIKPLVALASLNAWAEQTQTPIHFYLTSNEKDQNQWNMVYGMIRYIILAMVFITMFITTFGIMNVISINLFERRKEIGTYFCLGTEAPFLMATYTTEIFIVNFFGAVSGILIGLGARAFINALNITSSDPGFQVVMGGSIFSLGLSISTIVWILGGICIVTVLTALTTLGKALKVSPVVAVKETE